MHTLIICLLIGLGVDNAFVIVQEFNNSEEADERADVKRPLVKRIGKSNILFKILLPSEFFLCHS